MEGWSGGGGIGVGVGRVNAQCVLQVLINLHNGCLIAASIAVVGGAEYGHHILVMRPAVSLQAGGQRTPCEGVGVGGWRGERGSRGGGCTKVNVTVSEREWLWETAL